MTHEEKVQWMALWAARNHCALELKGECGFGRECVGIIKDGVYPDYDEEETEFVPENAYHKHNCVAVLGRGEESEAQLYDWLLWFDEHGYTVTHETDVSVLNDPIQVLLGKHHIVRMAKEAE